jgi:predicted metal-dependent HD superfamily phosphohydrolase
MRGVPLTVSTWGQLVRREHEHWTWELLRGAYAGPGRHYHTIDHVEACIRTLYSAAEVDKDVDYAMARLALIWHDVVYIPGDSKNEWLSAELLDGLAGTLTVDSRVLHFAQRCILATKHADSWKFDGNATVDAVLDIDLSILGAPGPEYALYVSNVRREFGAFTYAQWREGRSAFLRGMLSRPRIFRTDWGTEWFEDRARDNMTLELAEWRKAGW